MIDQFRDIWSKRRNTIILVLMALLFAQCTITPRLFPRTSLHQKFMKKAKQDSFGETPPGLKVQYTYGNILEYDEKSTTNFAFISTALKKNNRIILQKLGIEYLTKVKKRYDTKGYYSPWEQHQMLDDIKRGSPSGLAALEKLSLYCEKDRQRLRNRSSNSLPSMLCRTLIRDGFYYSFSHRGITIVSRDGKYVTAVFAIQTAQL